MALLGAVSGTGSITIANTANLELGSSASESIIFAPGSNSTLKLDHSASFTGQISGLNPNDKIDLADLTWVQGHMSASFAPNTSGGSLTVSNGTTKVKLSLLGNYTQASWNLSQDKTGGTTVVDPPATSHSLSDLIAQFGAGNGSSWSAADPTGLCDGGLLARTNSSIPDIAATDLLTSNTSSTSWINDGMQSQSLGSSVSASTASATSVANSKLEAGETASVQFNPLLLANYAAAFTDARQTGPNMVAQAHPQDTLMLPSVTANSQSAPSWHFS